MILAQTELHMYGSSRIGIYNVNIDVTNTAIISPTTIFTRGNKFFELSNHLGNVLVTVSDKKIQHSSNNSSNDYYLADVVTANDYYPFGMAMPGRQYTQANSNYRYGFNGKENENSIGQGNVDLGARIANVCLGRFFSKDPDEAKYPFQSTYVLASNNPVCLVDINGRGTNSTHIGKDGKVIAVIKDGDKSVYQHQNNSDGKTPTENQIKLRQKIYESTSANGKKVGETWTELGFADFGAYEKDGIVKPAEGAKIDLKSTWATEKVGSVLNSNPTVGIYAINARSGYDFDIKTKTPNGNVYFGSVLFGKYASARDAGNFIAGAVAQKSIIDNRVLDYGFGTYNQSSNNVGKSLLQIAGDFLFYIMPDTHGQAVYEIKNTIINGEDKLSKAGIEAGKEYIKNQK